MTSFGDRLLVLLIGGTAVGGLVVGWMGAFAYSSTQGWVRVALIAGLVVVFVAVLAGIWIELERAE